MPDQVSRLAPDEAVRATRTRGEQPASAAVPADGSFAFDRPPDDVPTARLCVFGRVSWCPSTVADHLGFGALDRCDVFTVTVGVVDVGDVSRPIISCRCDQP